jgi:hypothetical protein
VTARRDPAIPPKITKLPTPAECLFEAAQELTGGEYGAPSAQYARTWIDLAREIREGSQRPLVDRALDRLTLHDVEGIVCSHGRVAVRRRGGVAGSWFMHTDDRTNCDTPDEGREHERRRDRASEVDSMLGYQRGQADPPTHRQYEYALHVARRIAIGQHPLPADLTPVAEQLAAEVIERGAPIFDPQRVTGIMSDFRAAPPGDPDAELTRYDLRGPDPLLAGAMPRAFLNHKMTAPPAAKLADTVVIDAKRSTCRPPCNQPIHLAGEPLGEEWLHTATGQKACPSAGPLATATYAEPVAGG